MKQQKQKQQPKPAQPAKSARQKKPATPPGPTLRQKIKTILKTQFPNVFQPVTDGGVTVYFPLKVGIYKDLIDYLILHEDLQGYETKQISRTLKSYLTHHVLKTKYLMGVIHVGFRFDLYGTGVGEVTERERLYSIHRLESGKRSEKCKA